MGRGRAHAGRSRRGRGAGRRPRADEYDLHVRRWSHDRVRRCPPQVRGQPPSWRAWADEYARGGAAGRTTGTASATRTQSRTSRMRSPRRAPASVTGTPASPGADRRPGPERLPVELTRSGPGVARGPARERRRDRRARRRALDRRVVDPGRRANVVVTGLHRLPADEEEPAWDLATTWSFSLRRGEAGWEVRGWSYPKTEGPLPHVGGALAQRARHRGVSGASPGGPVVPSVRARRRLRSHQAKKK